MIYTPRRTLEHRRTLNVFVLAMLSTSVVISLRNLPLTAGYGLSLIFYYIAAALFFMIPYALVSAELASGWPKGGGVFIWVREALGDRFGFLAIWMQWFHNMSWYPVMLAFVAAALAQIIDPSLALHKGYLTSVILIGFWFITFLNFFGIKTSAFVSTLCVIIGVLIPGVILIGFGAHWYFSEKPISLSTELIPDLSNISNLVFLAGIFLALAGLEANANLAREVKNPKKNYPKAIFIAAALTIAILALGSLSIAIVIPKKNISLVSGLLDSFRVFFNRYGIPWLAPILAFFTALGALGELNAWTIAGVKGLFATTEYGHLPPILHKVNKKHVPVNLLFFQGLIVTIAALVFLYIPDVNLSYWMLSAWSAQMYLIMYIILFIAGLVLRYTKPEVPREYRVPFKNVGMWVCAIFGITSCLFGLFISLFPPMVDPQQKFKFETLLIAGFIVSIAIPLLIYALRKPYWKIEVLQEIREEIHRSIH